MSDRPELETTVVARRALMSRARSALPDAPVVPDRPGRPRQPLLGVWVHALVDLVVPARLHSRPSPSG